MMMRLTHCSFIFIFASLQLLWWREMRVRTDTRKVTLASLLVLERLFSCEKHTGNRRRDNLLPCNDFSYTSSPLVSYFCVIVLSHSSFSAIFPVISFLRIRCSIFVQHFRSLVLCACFLWPTLRNVLVSSSSTFVLSNLMQFSWTLMRLGWCFCGVSYTTITTTVTFLLHQC